MSLQLDSAGRYTATTWWYRHEPDPWQVTHGVPGYQPEPITHTFDTLDDAENDGQRWGCMAGVRRVEVRSPDSELQALWDKESRVVIKRRRYLDDRGRMLYDVSHVSNRWQRIGEESKELGRRKTAEMLTACDALRTELGRQPTSMQVVERLRRDRAASGSTK